MTPSRLILSTLLILAVAGVSACGRRAPLERPSDARYEQEREEARKNRQPAPAKPSKETPDRPFILDGLID
jgi:predicted small lipoprotein YifL